MHFLDFLNESPNFFIFQKKTNQNVLNELDNLISKIKYK